MNIRLQVKLKISDNNADEKNPWENGIIDDWKELLHDVDLKHILIFLQIWMLGHQHESAYALFGLASIIIELLMTV